MSRSIPDTSAHLQRRTTALDKKAARPVVLVIDPDPSARSVLEVGLGREGFEVWSADCGDAGLRLLKGRVPDVVVLESDLGGEEGFSFVAELRGTERLAQVPVLLLAGPSDENVELLAEVVGADAALRKPIFARDVGALVRLEIARRQGRDPLRFDATSLAPSALLRALLSSHRSGRFSLVDGRAALRFRAGRVIDVHFEGREANLDTLVRALAVTAGAYTLALEPVDGLPELQCTLKELVHQVMPRLQRWTKVMQRSLPLDARLAVDFGRLAQSLKSLPDQINRVVQLFDGFRTVKDVLVDSTFDETTTLEVATRLYLMGVLSPAKGEPSDLFFLRPMPRLFEPRAAEAEELMQRLFDGTAEIRAEALDEDASEDWYALADTGTGLEVADGDGGWTTAPVPSVLTAGLSPDLARHLDAFHTPMRVEQPEARGEARAARRFAAGRSEKQEADLELSLQHAAERSDVAEADLAAQLASATGRQARIETPWMTPVVTAEVVAPALAEGPPTVVVEPVLARTGTPEPSPRIATPVLLPAVAEDAEASFFADSPAAPATPDRAAPRRTRLPFVLAAVALLLLMAGIEALRARPVPVPTVAAPVVATLPVTPDLDAPEFYEFDDETAVAAPEAVVEAPPVAVAEEAVQQARRLYEAGQFRTAAAMLEDVVREQPGAVGAWLLLGLARYDARDAAGARAAAEQVLALDASNGRVQLLLATLAFDAGDRASARAALHHYLELEPEGAHVAEAKALLRR